EVLLQVEKKRARPGDDVLRVEELFVTDARGLPAVRSVNFAVRTGEILVVAGVQGNGQTELCGALPGLRAPPSARVLLGRRGGAGCRRGGGAGVRGARRDPGAVGPDRGDVPR